MLVPRFRLAAPLSSLGVTLPECFEPPTKGPVSEEVYGDTIPRASVARSASRVSSADIVNGARPVDWLCSGDAASFRARGPCALLNRYAAQTLSLRPSIHPECGSLASLFNDRLSVVNERHGKDLLTEVRPPLGSPHQAPERRLENPGIGDPRKLAYRPTLDFVCQGAKRQSDPAVGPDDRADRLKELRSALHALSHLLGTQTSHGPVLPSSCRSSRECAYRSAPTGLVKPVPTLCLCLAARSRGPPMSGSLRGFPSLISRHPVPGPQDAEVKYMTIHDVVI